MVQRGRAIKIIYYKLSCGGNLISGWIMLRGGINQVIATESEVVGVDTQSAQLWNKKPDVFLWLGLGNNKTLIEVIKILQLFA